jgi:hypothetical protein
MLPRIVLGDVMPLFTELPRRCQPVEKLNPGTFMALARRNKMNRITANRTTTGMIDATCCISKTLTLATPSLVCLVPHWLAGLQPV